MPSLDVVKTQIRQKLQLLSGAPQAEDLLTPEAKQRLSVPSTPAVKRLGRQAVPEIPKTGDFFGRDVLSPEERFTRTQVSPFRSIFRAPGKIGQVQEKVARFLAPQTAEEEATDIALSFAGTSGALKKQTGRVLRKAAEKGVELAKGAGEEIIKKGEKGLFDVGKKLFGGVSPKLEPLAQEARKYKSAEEFVNYVRNNSEPIYRGTIGTGEIDAIKQGKSIGGNWNYSYDTAKKYAESDLRDRVVGKIKPTGKGTYVIQGARMPDGSTIPIKVINSKTGETILDAKSQLTDFYNQVTKRVSKVSEELPGNLKRLNVAPDIKQHLQETIENIRPQLEKAKGGVLRNQEVLESAQKSEVLRQITSREATLKSEAALLRTRQHLAKLAENKELTPDFIDTLRVVSQEATKRGRELQALGIQADPQLGTIKTKLVKQLLDIGKSTDEILNASKGVDFNNAEQVTDFYRKFVKPKVSEVIDEFRYINLLSSPKTHIVNAFSNLLQATVLRPANRLASGLVDTVASKLTGKEQQFYIKQVPAYYKGSINALGDATSGFLKALRGQSIINRPDINRIPTGSKLLKPFGFIPKILEASDVFFRTLINAGEVEALVSKGVPKAEAVQQAAKTAEELVFRKALDPSNKTGQGAVLSGIDKMTSAVYRLRDAPGFKWFIPFVQTPMNILKQGIEYSPLGLATLPRNTNKIEQLGKTMVGSMVFAGAGWFALKDRTTWAVPTSQKEKDAFYAAGLQPYSLKMGDKWVSYSRLGPLAYPIAMASAIKFYTQQNPAAVSNTELEKTTKVLTGIAQFFSDQSYVEGLGNFVDLAQGDTTAVTRAAGNIPSQLIPLSSLLRWTANLIDPIYRKTESKFSVNGIIKNLEKGLPILSKNLEAYTTPFGQPSKRQFPVFQSFSPVGVTQEQPGIKSLFNLLQQKRRAESLKKSIKEKLKMRIQEQLSAQTRR